MYTIQAAGIFLAIASSTLAAQGCTPNALELTNLRRHHDINTGSTFAGQQVTKTQLRVAGGSGCSPVWAGGSYDDSAMFQGGEYPEALKRSVVLGNEAVMMRELVARHGPGSGTPTPKTPKRRHAPGDGMPMPKRRHSPGTPTPKTPKKRHTPGDGMPMPPKAFRRSAHGPDKDDGHFSMPQASKTDESESTRVLKPRHGPAGPAKSPTPPKRARRRSPAPHGPSKSPSTPKRVLKRSPAPHGPTKSPTAPKNVHRRTPAPHGPDDNDGHFSYPVDRVTEAEMEKRGPHGPDEDDGHFSYPVDRIQELEVEKRAPHGPDEDDGHFSYPVDRATDTEMEKRGPHGPDDNDGHFSYPVAQ